SELEEYKGEIDVVIGGPPCQGFSMAGGKKRNGQTGLWTGFVDDPKNHLFKEFVRIVDFIRPKFFVMENVAKMWENIPIRNEVTDSFKTIGYKKVISKVLDAADYGVPQHRYRVFFIGTLLDVRLSFPRATYGKIKNKKQLQKTLFNSDKPLKPYVSIKKAIGDLPSLKSGERNSIPNHVAMDHSEQMLEKMFYIKDGGDRSQIPEILRPKSGDPRKYIRYSSNEPSICITGDMRKVFHYEQNRALTVRELARIQTFPDDYVFYGTSISQQQQVGNAVPPMLAKVLALQILKYLKS
ncbi:MAG: DNA cytosine methyltransferase, partial [Candidatus Helarchaeota archaeon]